MHSNVGISQCPISTLKIPVSGGSAHAPRAVRNSHGIAASPLPLGASAMAPSEIESALGNLNI
jgi:hypothetical protein